MFYCFTTLNQSGCNEAFWYWLTENDSLRGKLQHLGEIYLFAVSFKSFNAQNWNWSHVMMGWLVRQISSSLSKLRMNKNKTIHHIKSPKQHLIEASSVGYKHLDAALSSQILFVKLIVLCQSSSWRPTTDSNIKVWLGLLTNALLPSPQPALNRCTLVP